MKNKNDFIIENGILKKYIGNSNIVVIPDEVISIGESAFYECKIITSVTIPDTVTSIEWAAFAYCSNLVNIEIPDSVTRIEGVAFDGCINLKNVKLPKNITIINERTFSNCENLNNIIIPNSVTSIEYDAFLGCNKLTSILIPDSVNSIKDGVFETCTNLINITIPDTIINIEGNPFENTPWLAKKRKENPLVIVNGFLIDGKTAEGNIIIPEEVNHICSFCFHKCEKLISVIIPEGVTDIGSYSFSGCTKLRKIEIPKSVSSISYKSFLNCKELINIKIPDSVTNIDSHSFDNTPWLAKKQKENPLVIVNGFLIDGKTAEGDIIIPEEVKHICDCCFLKCQNLISVFIPEGIVDIGIEVFRDCTKLRKIKIPESVSRIGDGAFWNCKELININIPDTVKIIGSRIFYGCEKLPKNILSKFSDKISNDNPKMPNKVNSTEIQQLSQNNYLTTKQKNNHNSISKLNNLVGLSAIKSDVIGLVNLIKIQNKRKDMGMKSVPISLHLVFSGNPGTGKTTVARILADIYKDIGILSKGHLVEVDRSGLVAGFVGQTALKTQEKINEAIGGILFIDEAYTLVKGGQDFGQEAVDTILKAMEDHREDFIVIVAGYSNLMHNFINSNPGLKSRFNKYINFPDYSADELIEIFYSMCNEYQYKLSTNADKTMREKIVLLEANKTKNFANARDVRNIFEKVITNQATRLAMSNSTDDIMEITEEDF